MIEIPLKFDSIVIENRKSGGGSDIWFCLEGVRLARTPVACSARIEDDCTICILGISGETMAYLEAIAEAADE